MSRARLLLVLVALLAQTALAQEGLVRFPALSTDPHYPYELWLRNESRVSRTVRLGDVRARLAPVTPDPGRVSSAHVVFAPQTPVTVELPPYSDGELPPYSNQVTVPFRLETNARRGVYALELELPGEFIWDNPPGFDQVIDYPLAHTPDLRVPKSYRPGQRFLFLGRDAEHYRRGARPLQHRQLFGRLLTLIGYRTGTAHFRVEGLPRAVSLSTSSRSRFPGLAPLLHDPALPALRRTYVGKRVWSYGGFDLTCSYNPATRIIFAGPPRKPLRVRRFVRVAWPTGFALAGSEGLGSYNAASPGDVMVATPLVVQFERPTGLTFSSAYGGEDFVRAHGRYSDAELLRRCPPAAELLADAWQLPTVLSLTPPPRMPRIWGVDDHLGLTRKQYRLAKGLPERDLRHLATAP